MTHKNMRRTIDKTRANIYQMSRRESNSEDLIKVVYNKALSDNVLFKLIKFIVFL